MRPAPHAFQVTLALALVGAAGGASALSLPPLGEFPPDWSCDAEVRVCAGAETGGAMACNTEDDGFGWCQWTQGWITRAWSEDGSFGSETHIVTTESTECRSFHGCSVFDSSEDTFTCSWAPLLSCDDSDETSFPRNVGAFLDMGECIHVSVRVVAMIEAVIEGPLAPLESDPATVRYTADSLVEGETCLVDDGR